jgi:hypothetical protein
MTIDLRKEVREALDLEWAGFAQRHPRLASVIERELLVEEAVATLAEDAAYRRAMAEAAAAAVGAGLISQLIRRLVGDWLRRLI